ELDAVVAVAHGQGDVRDPGQGGHGSLSSAVRRPPSARGEQGRHKLPAYAAAPEKGTRRGQWWKMVRPRGRGTFPHTGGAGGRGGGTAPRRRAPRGARGRTTPAAR